MGFYYLIVNLVLVSTNQNWLIMIGFNLGYWTGFVGFVILNWSAKLFTSQILIKQLMGYITFIVRLIFYGIITCLTIFFSFANLLSLIAGLSVLMLATITSELGSIFLNRYKNWRKRVKQDVSNNNDN